VHPSSVNFVWKGKSSSTYDLLYSTDSSFSDFESIRVTFSYLSNQNYILMGAFILGMLLILGPIRNNWNSLLLVTTVFAVFFIFNSCTEEITATDGSDIGEFSTTLTNLERNTTYYWKVLANSIATKEFSSESLVHHFITED